MVRALILAGDDIIAPQVAPFINHEPGKDSQYTRIAVLPGEVINLRQSPLLLTPYVSAHIGHQVRYKIVLWNPCFSPAPVLFILPAILPDEPCHNEVHHLPCAPHACSLGCPSLVCPPSPEPRWEGD